MSRLQRTGGSGQRDKNDVAVAQSDRRRSVDQTPTVARRRGRLKHTAFQVKITGSQLTAYQPKLVEATDFAGYS